MTRGVGGQSPSNIMKHLEGIDFPATKQDLVNRARQNDAPSEVMNVIQKLPGNKYGGPQDVMKDIGKVE